jgi:hypothetical protein
MTDCEVNGRTGDCHRLVLIHSERPCRDKLPDRKQAETDSDNPAAVNRHRRNQPRGEKHPAGDSAATWFGKFEGADNAGVEFFFDRHGIGELTLDVDPLAVSPGF